MNRHLKRHENGVPATYANVDDLMRDVGFKPATFIEDGIAWFVEWYKDFYKV